MIDLERSVQLYDSIKTDDFLKPEWLEQHWQDLHDIYFARQVNLTRDYETTLTTTVNSIGYKKNKFTLKGPKRFYQGLHVVGADFDIRSYGFILYAAYEPTKYTLPLRFALVEYDKGPVEKPELKKLTYIESEMACLGVDIRTWRKTKNIAVARLRGLNSPRRINGVVNQPRIVV